jgi:hypothetical protein
MTQVLRVVRSCLFIRLLTHLSARVKVLHAVQITFARQLKLGLGVLLCVYTVVHMHLLIMNAFVDVTTQLMHNILHAESRSPANMP